MNENSIKYNIITKNIQLKVVAGLRNLPVDLNQKVHNEITFTCTHNIKQFIKFEFCTPFLRFCIIA